MNQACRLQAHGPERSQLKEANCAVRVRETGELMRDNWAVFVRLLCERNRVIAPLRTVKFLGFKFNLGRVLIWCSSDNGLFKRTLQL